jgi:hypothetical protein
MELAVRAGFSERLVRKGESGEPVRMKTVKILARARSTNAERLQARDLIDDPLAVAQSFVRAYLIPRRGLRPAVGPTCSTPTS